METVLEIEGQAKEKKIKNQVCFFIFFMVNYYLS